MSASETHPYFTGNDTYKAINPIVSQVGDFTPFYITIAICSVLLGLLLILNIACCCSRHSDYWLDRHTGNRWVVSIWSSTPHKQPPLDFTELREVCEVRDESGGLAGRGGHGPRGGRYEGPARDYLELQGRESDI